MDVTNPGLVNVANQAFNPSTSVQSLAIPEDDDVLVPVADQGSPLARNYTSTKDGTVTRGPTPTQEIVINQSPASPSQNLGQIPGIAPLFLPFPQNEIVNTVEQQIVPQAQTSEFTVAGPTTSIQTNQNNDTQRSYVVTSVLDADTGQAPGVSTTRYKLGVSPSDLMSFGISLLGRQIVFDDNTLTASDAGATRFVSFYKAGYLIINQQEPNDPIIPVLTTPQVGDAFYLFIQRQGSEMFSESLGTAIDVTIFPPPAINTPSPPQAALSQGNIEISTGPQPGAPIITGGVQVPTAINVKVASQATAVGLPTNVYI
jgi:hypothetical protein